MRPPLAAPLARVVILGFMGAGKSTVGPLLASALGWDFVDLDEEIARVEGAPVSEIVRRRGVAHFRQAESDAGKTVLERSRVVVAVGGGWAAEPGHMDQLDAAALSVWLRVRPATALARIEGTAPSRPLLEVADPLATAEALLQRRTAHYGRSDISIDTEGRSPEGVVREILEYAELRDIRALEGPAARGSGDRLRQWDAKAQAAEKEESG